MANKQTWYLEDHLCKSCGGRILRGAAGHGPSGGGNPIFKCADCGKSASTMGPDVLCWCGFSHKHNHNSTAYRCFSYSALVEFPDLIDAFKACGCDPKRGGEVGILLEDDLRRIISSKKEENESIQKTNSS